jgi:hypothetical protein
MGDVRPLPPAGRRHLGYERRGITKTYLPEASQSRVREVAMKTRPDFVTAVALLRVPQGIPG